MQIFNLIKYGMGSFEEIKKLDSPEFLDMLEYYAICSKIESYEITKAMKR